MAEKRELRQAVGNWVAGETFFDRESELAAFMELLEEGANVLLVAARRTGKTSLMREAALHLGEQMASVFVDLEGSETPEDAIVAIGAATHSHQGLFRRTLEFFRNAVPPELKLDELTLRLRDEVRGDWRAKGDRLLALLARDERPVVIFLDEVPILVNRLVCDPRGELRPEGRAAADGFMSWLRSAAQRHQGKLRFVLSGSIGLGPVLRRVGLSATLNGFTPFVLEPWPDDVAQRCLLALARNYGVDLAGGAAGAMTARLGCCIPHHVQLFFSHVRDDARRRATHVVTPIDADRVYDERLLGNRGHAMLSHYEERLRQVLDPSHRDLAADLLTEAAVTGRLVSPAAIALAAEHVAGDSGAALDEVLGVLEHDGYIAREGASYVFVSKLVRDWWRARFGFRWTPVVERPR
ncbi:MAG: ATP-binding protein [Myxococcales bacterium]|nr:ATP-binding protein [Myxococcales bacterium]MCB9735043.1 ATP-binding protein [Deltaproteobacteria bacterium]